MLTLTESMQTAHDQIFKAGCAYCGKLGGTAFVKRLKAGIPKGRYHASCIERAQKEHFERLAKLATAGAA